MARKKISEFRAKTLVNKIFGIEYRGVSVGPQENVTEMLKQVQDDKLFVVKVDQGVKKRGKQGLVKIKVHRDDIPGIVDEFRGKGFEYFLLEEFLPHEITEEKYLSLSRTRDGIEAFYSAKGGVDIEENQDSIKKFVFPYKEHESQSPERKFEDMETKLGVTSDFLEKLIVAFEENYFSFLEINPLVVQEDSVVLLDLAVEVDSAAEFFIHNAWTREDFREYSSNQKTDEEKNISKLAEESQASFSLTVLNPNGAIWMLLSGGGASIVLADEAYNQGMGQEVGNYGEYSGNPNTEETYYYTKQVLSLLFKSNAQKKVLIVGGGVANFTDIKKTFTGVIRAIEEVAAKLRENSVKVFVRRGGPNQEEGLRIMREFLEKENLYGQVSGPDVILTDVMNNALKLC